jgi:hypothetical protein
MKIVDFRDNFDPLVDTVETNLTREGWLNRMAQHD